jgi:hypothetical protein
MPVNFGDFQNNVYAEAVRGGTSRFPFDFATIERKAREGQRGPFTVLASTWRAMTSASA